MSSSMRPEARATGVRTLLLSVPVVMVLVALAAIGATGGLSPLGIEGLPDPGALTRVGLPTVQVVRDLASMVTVGVLVIAATCVPPTPAEAEGLSLGRARRRLVACAQLTASVWAVASLVLVAFIYSDASGSGIGRTGFASEAIFFAFGFELGQYGLWGAALAVLVAMGCVLSTRIGGVGITTVLALVALWPMALTGHGASRLNHDEAVNLQFFHLIGISVWVGGLVALVVARRLLGESLVVTVRRYSTLAGWCLALVTVSGTLGAWLRLPSASSVLSSYGALLALKLAAVVVVAMAGWWHRRRTIADLARGSASAFSRLVGVELLVLVSAAGLGVALSRTAPPAPPEAPRPLTSAESLLGRPLPDPIDASQWFAAWNVDTLFLPLGVAGILWYLWAVGRLRRRGDSWSWLRTVSWLVGCLLFVWATSGAPGTYGRVLFSMHMVQHMTIATGVPVFLVLGTPITLALRVLRRRDDGSRGPREWLTSLTRSFPLHVLGHPLVAAGMFVVSMVAFYYTSAFETSLESHTAHVVMTLHFLLTGYLFAESVVGADPGLRRPPYPMRVLLIMVTFGFHALFAVSMMASSTVFAADWFQSLGRTWGRSPLDDQYLGAQIGWLMGEYPILVMAAALVVGWVRADGRERRRFDRREAREDDKELHAYNAYLTRLGSVDLTRTAGRPTMERRSPQTAGEKEQRE
ncbi:cytochrome c oxidase assembly protein [uncultured Nocardioides sp.]|uniref:cytochrome c oxidase assembly protein n=1 Tax=uncultured Nocardioides sp. TaxID=198441 RepID=UPI00260958CB|nr:cytochrome c oxidase assembly protein [uncultured Nocardioides sp.]